MSKVCYSLHRRCCFVEGSVQIDVSPTNWSGERCSNLAVEYGANSSVNPLLSETVAEVDHHVGYIDVLRKAYRDTPFS